MNNINFNELRSYLEENKFEFYSNQTVGSYTTMRIGGKAALVIIAHQKTELLDLLNYIHCIPPPRGS